MNVTVRNCIQHAVNGNAAAAAAAARRATNSTNGRINEKSESKQTVTR